MGRSVPAALAGQPWPEVPADDPLAEVARRFVVNLRNAIGVRSARSVAVAAGISHGTLNNILHGQVWPDLSTIARLEQALQTNLWPQQQF
ncbi:helix-turn-helix domain-containing protein [Curtobacterium sp. MCBD17_023]|uniref:helix-turn-helix domain-containing protein n=1 Tax=Curtobacterium sp. MCBD17_023 TaxID=2175657 RepID=UPI000D8222C0|nr:XRE family transcriptional regulator [Curtobacterium sp. MCBD17_023]